jgi:uncharacterized protein YbjQ (UPF0145 family)
MGRYAKVCVMGNDATTAAEEYLSRGDFSRAIRALQTLGAAADRTDYKALIRLAREIREQTSKGRERVQCDGLIAHAEKSIRFIDHPEERVVIAIPSPFRQGLPVSTSNDVPGWEITEYVGEVFGLIVRSRGAFPTFGANLKSVVGGELKTMTNLLRDTRKQAIERMVEEAEARGADAVIAMRFDVTSMGDTAGWTEICAYGTAVRARELADQEMANRQDGAGPR